MPWSKIVTQTIIILMLKLLNDNNKHCKHFFLKTGVVLGRSLHWPTYLRIARFKLILATFYCITLNSSVCSSASMEHWSESSIEDPWMISASVPSSLTVWLLLKNSPTPVILFLFHTWLQTWPSVSQTTTLLSFRVRCHSCCCSNILY